MELMTIKVRTLTPDEVEILDHWQRADDAVSCRRARILRLSTAGWSCSAIAEAPGIHVETVRSTIKAFNEAGIIAIAPRPRLRGR